MKKYNFLFTQKTNIIVWCGFSVILKLEELFFLNGVNHYNFTNALPHNCNVVLSLKWL